MIIVFVALCVLGTGFIWLMWRMVTPDSPRAASHQHPNDDDTPDTGLVTFVLAAHPAQNETWTDDNSGSNITSG